MDTMALSKIAAVSRAQISAFENGHSKLQRANALAIRGALEAAGVVFVDENGEGPGVRLKKDRSAASIPVDQLNAENDE